MPILIKNSTVLKNSLLFYGKKFLTQARIFKRLKNTIHSSFIHGYFDALNFLINTNIITEKHCIICRENLKPKLLQKRSKQILTMRCLRCKKYFRFLTSQFLKTLSLVCMKFYFDLLFFN
jgi:hypothetical protein